MKLTKTPAEKAANELRSIAQASLAPLKIIESARAEVISDNGPNLYANEVELQRRCDSGDHPLRDARDKIIAHRLDTERHAQPVIAQVEEWESEINRLHAENLELVRRTVFDAVRVPLGEPLARKCSLIAPAVLDEQTFQAQHQASRWGQTFRRKLAQAHVFDGQNIADQIAVQYSRIEPTVLAVRHHTEDLRKRLNADVAS